MKRGQDKKTSWKNLILGSEAFRFKPAFTFLQNPLRLDYSNVANVDVVCFHQLVEKDERRLCSKKNRARVKFHY